MVKKIFHRSWSKGLALASAIFTLFPESIFSKIKIFSTWNDDVNILVARVLVCVAAFILVFIVYAIYYKRRKRVVIKGKGYSVIIQEGDLLEIDNGIKIISFDECFTTHVGNKPEDINPTSLCGQYLNLHPGIDVKKLIKKAGLQSIGKSEFKGKTCYESGRCIQDDDGNLLLAFAKLNERGKGYMTYEEYLKSLSVLWEEIETYYGQNDVYMPILGSGTTKFDSAQNPTQQELLDVMIESYTLSRHKIKLPNKIHIVYRTQDGFSVNNIDVVE